MLRTQGDPRQLHDEGDLGVSRSLGFEKMIVHCDSARAAVGIMHNVCAQVKQARHLLRGVPQRRRNGEPDDTAWVGTGAEKMP